MLVTKWISPVCNCWTIWKWQNSKSTKREISVCLWFEGKERWMNRGFFVCLFRVRKLFLTEGMYLCTCIKSTDGRTSGVDSNIYSNMLYHRKVWTACRVELCSVRVYLFTSFWCEHRTSLKISSIKNQENTFMKDLIIYVSKKKTKPKWLLSHPVGWHSSKRQLISNVGENGEQLESCYTAVRYGKRFICFGKQS